MVKADSGQIEQVLTNLCFNSRDAMPEGGMIKISTKNMKLSHQESEKIPGLAAGDYLLLSVSDNGPGIPLQVQERIFEPFFTTKKEEKGTGLGLAIVQQIVKNHSGSIQLDTSPDKGTSFNIFIPAVSQKKLAQADKEK
jgi:signal transduction histidine kinase